MRSVRRDLFRGRRRTPQLVNTDTGKVEVFGAKPPFTLLATLDTGPITNHVNIVRNALGIRLCHGRRPEPVNGDPHRRFQPGCDDTGRQLPHGVWPSGDGTRVYVWLENGDKLTAIDTSTNTVIATAPIGQAAQAVAYLPGAVPPRRWNAGASAARCRR